MRDRRKEASTEGLDGDQGRKVQLFGVEGDACFYGGNCRDVLVVATNMKTKARNSIIAFRFVASGDYEVEVGGWMVGEDEFINEATADGKAETAVRSFNRPRL